ncbi:MAG: hypothetical protein HYY78_16940 [Betaproteobacteria bacterium]|nr:hypothetical protein [Betaproteobacteria bacterium]
MDLPLCHVLEPALYLGGRQGKTIDYHGHHHFDPCAKGVGIESPYRVRRINDDDVWTPLRGRHAPPELRKSVRGDHYRGDATLFHGGRDVATPRRAGPSVAAGDYYDIGAPRKIVQLIAHAVEQFPPLGHRRHVHRRFHHYALHTAFFLKQRPDSF